MGAIRLSKRDINSGVSFALATFKKADTNRTGRVYGAEISAYRGQGAAALKKIYAYGRHVEGGSEGQNVVALSTLKRAVPRLAGALKKIADEKGNKDGKLDGTAAELGKASTAAAALARLAHAIK